MIVIVDYGMGNLGSIQNMIKRIGYSSTISDNKKDVESASKIILPGVGAFDTGINNLKKIGLFDIINAKVLDEKIPILGICLGMQLMANKSEEGITEGFKWINADFIKFRQEKISEKITIPHMGWNNISVLRNSKLFNNMYDEPRFYFVHSYHAYCSEQTDEVAQCFYGYNFVAVYEHENIYGVQFHPEKSHKFGMLLLKNFIEEC